MWTEGADKERVLYAPDTAEVQQERVLLTAAYHLGGWAARWGWGTTSLAQGRPATVA